MPNIPADLRDLARKAAVEIAPYNGVGEFISLVDEGDDVYTYLFDARQKGYVGWRWSVTIYQPENGEPTISEALLIAGEDSLLAPAWVPWAERLADYKALQAELEAQAALEAEEAEDDDAEDAEDDVDDVDDAEDLVSAEEEAEVLEEAAEEADDLAVASDLTDEGVNSENDSEDTGKRPPRFLRRRRGRIKFKRSGENND